MYVIDTDHAARVEIERASYRLSDTDPDFGPGCIPRSSSYGGHPFLIPAYKLVKPIPRADWISMIRDGQGDFLSDHRKGKLPPHDQGSTNYCWAHGSVRGLEALRCYEGQSAILLSAESVAVPLTGGRNRGGSPDEAVNQLHGFGACEQRFWPLNNRDERSALDGWDRNREQYQILDWLDVIGWDMQVTLALHRIPVPIGLGWWGHLVCQLDPVELDSKTVGIGIDNSWGPDWGENGYGVLDEKHGTADLGAFSPISATFPRDVSKYQ